MTEPTRYECFLDEFGERLSAVARGSRRRRLVPRLLRRRPVAWVAIGAGVIAVAGIGAARIPTGGRLDVAERANAALAPAGEIIYMRLTTTPVATGPSMPVPEPQTTEVWSASNPARWRFVQTIPDDLRVVDARGFYRGRQEFAYADGIDQYYVAERDRLDIVTGPSGAAGKRAPSVVPIDPERDIRPLLDRGELSDRGTTTIDGRLVRRLVGETARKDGRATRRVVYEVDADTFEPVAGVLEVRMRQELVFRQLFHVDAYERLPDDAEHAPLLRIQTTPRTRVRTRKAVYPQPRPAPPRVRTTTVGPR